MTVPTLETLSRPVEAASTVTRRWPLDRSYVGLLFGHPLPLLRGNVWP